MEKKTIFVGVKITPTMKRDLHNQALIEDLSESDIIRISIKNFISRNNQKQTLTSRGHKEN